MGKVFFNDTNEGLRCLLKVTPNAKSDKINDIAEVEDNKYALKVSVTAVPENGKANKAVIKLLSKAWKLPKTDISVVSGHNSRLKVLLIKNVSEAYLASKLDF